MFSVITGKMTPFYNLLLLIHIEIIAQWKCVGIVFDRDGIDVIPWPQLQRLYAQNELDLTKPFIVIESPSSDWTLLHNNYKGLYNAFKHYGKLSIDTRTTDCSCFKLPNNTIDIETCYEFVSNFKYVSKQKTQEFHINKSSSFWDRYEPYFPLEYPYEQCIKRYRVHKPMQYILTHWDEFIMNDKNNDLNKKKPKLTSRRVTFNVITSNQGQLMMDDVSMEVMKHIDIQPFSPIFGLKQGIHSLHDMNLWFGSNNYRLIRHTDTSDNLFFVLNGTKKFRIAAPYLINHPDFPFILYPFLHSASRSAYPVFPIYGTQYKAEQYDIDLHKDEVLWLPSGWWHEVVNGEIGSIGLNLWFGDGPTMLKQRMHRVKVPLSGPRIGIDEMDGMLYLINRITQYFDHEDMDKQYGFMFTYFRRMYPILNVIYDDNLAFERNGNNDMNWLYWLNGIIDVNSIAKCEGNKDIFDVLHHVSYSCTIPTKKEKWDAAVAGFFSLFDRMSDIPLPHRQEIVSTYLETILYYVKMDAVFTPILVALQIYEFAKVIIFPCFLY
eukprot:468145_1